MPSINGVLGGRMEVERQRLQLQRGTVRLFGSKHRGADPLCVVTSSKVDIESGTSFTCGKRGLEAVGMDLEIFGG